MYYTLSEYYDDKGTIVFIWRYFIINLYSIH